MKNSAYAAITAVTLLILTTPLSAGTLVQFPLTNNGNPSYVDPIVGSYNFAANPAIQYFEYGSEVTGYGEVLQVAAADGATDPASAFSTNSYFFLTLTASPGNTLNLTQLSFDVAAGGPTAFTSGFFIRSDVDSFAADIYAEGLPTGAPPPPTQRIIDLSALQFQNLASITLRFYVYTPVPGNDSVDWRTLVVSGVVPEVDPPPTGEVPEPQTLGLMFAGLAALAGFRRFRKN